MPSDVEAAIEINRHWMWFEFKTEGAPMSTGQRLFYERRLMADFAKGCLMICEHEPLERVIQPMSDVTFLTVWMYDEAARRLCYTPRMETERETTLGWWIQEWCSRAEGRPSSFVTEFRKHSKVYPGEPCPKKDEA